MKPRKLVYGVGVNDSGYAVKKFETIKYVESKQKRKLVWTCPYYQTWTDMLKRCYSAKFQERQPTYKGCSVSKEWLTFSNFKAWMEKQEWEGLQIDKDILIKGNQVYSSDACVFVTEMVNNFVINRGADRGEWLIGVSWYKQTEKFQAYCNNPFTKKKEHLGYFTSEQQAHQVWRKRKNELAHKLAAIQTDPRVAKALISRYSSYPMHNY